MKRKLIPALLLTFATAASLQAQTAFDRAVAMLVDQNYDLLVSSDELGQQVLELKAENNLPETEVSFSQRWGSENSTKTGLEINQGFDWPGLYRSRGKEQSLTKDALRQLQISRLEDKRMKIKLLLVDYISAKKQVALASEIYEQMKQLSAHYVRAYESGEVSILDRNKVIVETSRAEAALMVAEHNREDAVSAILAEGRDNSVMPLLAEISEYPVQELFSEEEYERLINSEDPMIAYYRKMEEVAAQKLKSARLGYMPSFSVGYGFEREEGQNFHGFNIGIGLPLFSNRNKTAIAATQRMEYMNNLHGETVRQLSKMRGMVADVKLLDSTISSMKKVFADDSQTALLRKAFDGGEINLFTYLSDLTFFTEAYADLLDAEYNRAKILVELNRLKL